MSDFEQRLAALSPAKRALLQARLERRGRQSQTIPKRPEHDVSPLSFVQERIWLHEQLVPGSVVYNRPTNLRLRGPLQTESLRKALNVVVEAHESLRTTVTLVEDSPLLRLHSRIDLDLPFSDLSGEDVPEQSAEQLAIAEAQRPFDLEKGPLVRAHLLRLDSLDHLLLLTFHHFTFDAWSQTVLLEELTSTYESYNAGATPELIAPQIQYGDFATWERCEQHIAGLNAGRSYWREELADPPFLQLPTDCLRPAVPSEEAGYIDIELPAELVTGLRKLSASENTTMFSVLLAAYSALLYRYSWQNDIVVGCPVAGRTHQEMEKLIGVFINTLPLRVHLEGTDTFRGLLQRVRGCVIQGLQHQEVPFQYVVQDVLKDRAIGGSPLFQAMFVHERFPLSDRPGSTLRFTPEEAPSKSTMVDILLELMESSNRISGRFLYRRELWEHDTIEQMAGHYQTLLAGIVANPDQSICDLPLLSEPARKTMAAKRNTVTPDNEFVEFHPQENESISQRFESMVARSPEQIAVRTTTDTWTYARLDALANRIAHAILATSKNREGQVALLFDHGASMIAALLGALKAGQAFVPLDPMFPLDRLKSMLLDSQASILLTEDAHTLLASQIGHDSLTVINSDALSPPGSRDELPVIPSDRHAYLLYTSGTTGQPKAVIQNHRNVLRHSAIYTNSIHICDRDKLTLFSSYTFDAAMMDIFGALLNGATLCPVKLRTSTAEQVWEWLDEAGATILHATPTAYRHLVRAIPANFTPSSVRVVVLGGESVYLQDVKNYRETFRDDCLLVNGLGPTESTLAMQYHINKQTPLRRNSIPVGYAVPDTEVLLLNESGGLSDVFGEIAIRSRQIAVGYWRRPELTALKFSSNTCEGHSRTFRTRDMGRMLADGSIEFIGRNDSQLKLRGYRIEPGEIETVLNAHPDIVESLVTLNKDHPEDKQLVAHCVSGQNSVLNTSELKNYLRSTLPEYMVPAVFTPLDALPLTSTGKINRQAPLPATKESAESTCLNSEPQDFIEQRLLQIWQQLFGRNSIDRQDNFFDLGGHSLLAVRLVAEIEKLLGYSLPIASLFQTATIESLAGLIREDQGAAPWKSLVPLQPRGSKPPFYFVHGQYGDVFVFVSLARYLAPDQPAYGLQAIDRYGGTERHTSVEEMAAHYVEEIRSFQPEGPYYLGSYSSGGWFAYEVAQQLTRQGQSVGMLALFDTKGKRRLPLLMALRFRTPRVLRTMTQRFFFHAREFLSLPRQELFEYFRGCWATLLYRLWGRYHQPLPQLQTPTDKIPHPGANQIVGKYYQGLSLRYRPIKYAGVVDLFASEQSESERPSLFQHLAKGGVRIHSVSGDHFTMMDEDHVQDLAEEFVKVLKLTRKELWPGSGPLAPR